MNVTVHCSAFALETLEYRRLSAEASCYQSNTAGPDSHPAPPSAILVHWHKRSIHEATWV
jgi:hypothetical protein